MGDFKVAIELSTEELCEITTFAVLCAQRALPIFEQHVPGDSRPREAIEAAIAFSKSGLRTNALRGHGFAAFKAARETDIPAAIAAAQAATQAVGAAYLHPLADSRQVKHLLGSAAYAAHAAELNAGDDTAVGIEYCNWAIQHAPPVVAKVLARYPAPSAAGGRSGELLRYIDEALRRQT